MQKLTRFLAVILVCCFTFSAFASDSNNLMGVIDAGSTGSRLHVYQFERDEHHDPIHIREIWVNRVKPGFATVATNESAMTDYMQKLTADCPYSQIPVYFYATGGMRFQSDADQTKGYNSLKKWFAQKPQFELRDVRTIPGKEEALYDWLAMNYHEGSFANSSKWVGVIDIGGASTQITFPVKNTQGTAKHDQQTIKIYGQNITLFTHSFLGLGETEVTHQYLDEPSCFPKGFKLPDGDSGAGDAKRCVLSLKRLVNGVHGADQFQSTVAKAINQKWFLMSGPTHVLSSEYFNEQNNNQFVINRILQHAQEKVCSQNWKILHKQYPQDNYLSGYCLLPAYYYSLLVNGYGISHNATVNITPPDQEIDWTMGVVLAQANTQ